jgi:hypothetical protein
MRKEAERREGMKESGLRHGTIASRLSSSLSSCLFKAKRKWQWEMMMIHVHLFEREWARMRKRHCEKGYHKFMHATETISYRDRKKTVDYINCPTCGMKFFSTIQDKRKYLAMTSTHRKIQKKAWKGIR